MIYFILGGARSGKSRYAEHLAKEHEKLAKRIIYIATAECLDDEMQKRINHHQSHRPSHWHTIEEPYDLAAVIDCYDNKETVLLIDCLTLWLTNLLSLDDDNLMNHYKQALIERLKNTFADVIVVSNETGLGVVPMGQLSRRFVDESGFLHQSVAAMADEVIFCVAGLPLTVKSSKQTGQID